MMQFEYKNLYAVSIDLKMLMLVSKEYFNVGRGVSRNNLMRHYELGP